MTPLPSTHGAALGGCVSHVRGQAIGGNGVELVFNMRFSRAWAGHYLPRVGRPARRDPLDAEAGQLPATHGPTSSLGRCAMTRLMRLGRAPPSAPPRALCAPRAPRCDPCHAPCAPRAPYQAPPAQEVESFSRNSVKNPPLLATASTSRPKEPATLPIRTFRLLLALVCLLYGINELKR